MKKLKKLCRGYVLVALSALACDKLLFYFTGIAFRNSTVRLRGELIVEYGVAYRNHWRDAVVFYSIMFFLIATVLALLDDKKHYTSLADRFLLSSRIHALTGILFVFSSLGLILWGKRIPDALSVVMLPFSAVCCFLIATWWVAKELYIYRKKTSRPNKRVDAYN